MNIVWNADKYKKDFSFVHQYGDDVAELMDCKQGSTVLDLGCGNGAGDDNGNKKNCGQSGAD